MPGKSPAVNMIGIGINVKLINGSLKALKNALDKAKNAGFDVVELPLHGLDVIVGGGIRDQRLKEIRNILKDYPFAYSVHCPESLNLMNLEGIAVEKAVLKSSVEFSHEIGARILVYHPGRFKSEVEILLSQRKKMSALEKTELKKKERDILKEFSLILRQAKVVLGMENARPFIGEKGYTYAEDIGELVRQVKDIGEENIGITLDIGHAYLSTNFYQQDFIKTITKVKPWLKHIHLHDNFGCPSYFQEKDQDLLVAHGRGDMHMPPGWGKIPFEKAIEILEPAGCFLVMEVRSRYFEYIKESRQRLEALIDGLLTSRAFLRGVTSISIFCCFQAFPFF